MANDHDYSTPEPRPQSYRLKQFRYYSPGSYTKAPSEKHLEDWIVNNPLLFGEVWPKNSLAVAHDKSYVEINDDQFIMPFCEQIIARQFSFPFGRADLVARAWYRLTVIELKSGQIKSDAVIQCMKYLHDMEFIALSAVFGEDYRTNGLLVGYGRPENDILIACAFSAVTLISYEYDPENEMYWFNNVDIQSLTDEVIESFSEYGYGVVGENMRLVVSNLKELRGEQ